MKEVLTIVGISSGVVGIAMIFMSNSQTSSSNRIEFDRLSMVGTTVPFERGCLVVLPECDSCVAKSVDVSVARKSEEVHFLHPNRKQAGRHWNIPLEKFVAEENVNSRVREQLFANGPLVYRVVKGRIDREFSQAEGVTQCINTNAQKR